MTTAVDGDTSTGSSSMGGGTAGLGEDCELEEQDEASWTWVHALRAKRWKHVYVAARP